MDDFTLNGIQLGIYLDAKFALLTHLAQLLNDQRRSAVSGPGASNPCMDCLACLLRKRARFPNKACFFDFDTDNINTPISVRIADTIEALQVIDKAICSKLFLSVPDSVHRIAEPYLAAGYAFAKTNIRGFSHLPVDLQKIFQYYFSFHYAVMFLQEELDTILEKEASLKVDSDKYPNESVLNAAIAGKFIFINLTRMLRFHCPSEETNSKGSFEGHEFIHDSVTNTTDDPRFAQDFPRSDYETEFLNGKIHTKRKRNLVKERDSKKQKENEETPKETNLPTRIECLNHLPSDPTIFGFDSVPTAAELIGNSNPLFENELNSLALLFDELLRNVVGR